MGAEESTPAQNKATPPGSPQQTKTVSETGQLPDQCYSYDVEVKAEGDGKTRWGQLGKVFLGQNSEGNIHIKNQEL